VKIAKAIRTSDTSIWSQFDIVCNWRWWGDISDGVKDAKYEWTEDSGSGEDNHKECTRITVGKHCRLCWRKLFVNRWTKLPTLVIFSHGCGRTTISLYVTLWTHYLQICQITAVFRNLGHVIFLKKCGSTHFQAVSCSILGQIAWFFFWMSTFNQSGGAHNIILIYIYCGILLDSIITWILQFAAGVGKQGCYVS